MSVDSADINSTSLVRPGLSRTLSVTCPMVRVRVRVRVRVG